MTIEIHQFNCRSDNFGVLIHDSTTKATASIDAPEEKAILEALEHKGWTLSDILTTHHHGDHVEANLALKEKFGVKIHGPADEASKIPGLDHPLKDNDEFTFAGQKVHVITTPGHTAGHIVYHFVDLGVLFAGDTLFSLGCGRLFERGPDEMFKALKRLSALDPRTQIYCGHEYTKANAAFALSIDPKNEALIARASEVDALLAQGKSTLPTTLGRELGTNPFLRYADRDIRIELNMLKASDEEVFAELRRRKDNF